MKKTFLIFGLAAIASIAFSCTREDGPIEKETIPSEEQTTPGEEQETSVDLSQYDPSKYLVSFGASIEDVTKAEIDLATGAVSFQNNDLVLVVSGNSSAEYKYNGTEFVVAENNTPVEKSGEIKAYYPKDKYTYDAGTGTVTFTMPEATTANPGALAPMCGVITENTASFKNLGAILALNLTGAEPITAIELITDKKITGSSALSWNEGIPAIGTLDGATSVKYEYTSAIAAETATSLYFFLPAGVEFGSLEIHAIYGKTVGEVTYEPFRKISRNSSMTPARNEIVSITKTLSGFFSGGDGLSEATAYEIANANDFKKISTLANATEVVGGNGYNATAGRTFFGSEGVYYKQTADIDIENAPLTPIGSDDVRFAGVYDGNSKIISNITIGDGDSYGLFGFTTGAIITDWKANNIKVEGTGHTRGAFVGYMVGGEVSNCDVTGNSTVSGNGPAIGGIVGRIQGAKATVTGCESTANVVNTNEDASLNYATGGIVGLVFTGASGSEIANCSLLGNVSSVANSVGGIVGRYYIAGTLSNCTTSAETKVSGNGEVGGIVGGLDKAHVVVSGCKNSASVEATGEKVGGIAGLVQNGSEVLECWSKAEITGANLTGGIVGYLNDFGAIVRCYSKGSVSGNQCVGGIVGHAYASNTSETRGVLVMECLSRADVISSTGSNSNSGGVVGRLHSAAVGTNIQWASVLQCVGGPAIIKNTNTENCTRFGAFVGFLNTEISKTNGGQVRCQVRNSYTTVETDKMIWLASSVSNTGGFVGQLQRGRFHRCYYQLDANSQVATASKNLVTIEEFQKVDSDFASFLTNNLQTTTGYTYVANGKTYNASDWTMTGYNGESLEYPLPSALVALGTEYYD